MAQARAWYDSPVYRDLRPIRQRSATSRVFVVDSGASAVPPTVPTAAPGAMTITPRGSQASTQGAEQMFTGAVRIDPLFPVKLVPTHIQYLTLVAKSAPPLPISLAKRQIDRLLNSPG